MFTSVPIDKVYINESGGSEAVAVVLLAHTTRVGHEAHFYKGTIPLRDLLSVRLGPIPMFAVRMGWGNFLNTK